MCPKDCASSAGNNMRSSTLWSMPVLTCPGAPALTPSLRAPGVRAGVSTSSPWEDHDNHPG
eukprot:542107-Prorocentrum_lima.AAC.1